MHRLSCALLLSIPILSFADAIAPFRENHEAAVAQLDKEIAARSDKLKDGYIEALGALQKSYQSQGDLDHLLIVRAEIERFEKQRTLTKADANTKVHALLEIQRKLHDSIEKLAGEDATRRLELLRRYEQQLTEARKNLTVANKLDDASAVETERKQIAGQVAEMERRRGLPQKSRTSSNEQTVEIAVNEKWPFQLRVKRGETIRLQAAGRWKVRPAGRWRGPGDDTFYLEGRLDEGAPFKVGLEYTLKIQQDATLHLGMKEGGFYKNNRGGITVKITRSR